MKVLLICPGEAPRFGELNGVDEMRSFVGGTFETVSFKGYQIVCNESFLLNESPFNVCLGDTAFFGNIFVCKIGFVDGEFDLVGLDDSDLTNLDFVEHFLNAKGSDFNEL